MYKPPSKISGLKKHSHLFSQSSAIRMGFIRYLSLIHVRSKRVASLGLKDSRWLHSHVWSLSKDGWNIWGLAGPLSLCIVCLGRSSQFFSWCLPTKRIKKWELQSYLVPKLGSHIVLPTSTAFFWSRQVIGPAQVKGEEKWTPLPREMSSKITFQMDVEVRGIVLAIFENNLLKSSPQSQFTFLLQAKYIQLVPHSLIPLLYQAQNLVAHDLYQVHIQIRYRNS